MEIPQKFTITQEENNSFDIEIDFQEKILFETEKIYDLIELLDRANNSNWSSCKFQSEGLAKINLIKQRLNGIHERSIALPAFVERLSMKDQEIYGYISMMLTAWEQINEKLKVSQQIVFSLPLSLENAQIREEKIKNISLKETELKNISKKFIKEPSELDAVQIHDQASPNDFSQKELVSFKN